MSADHVEGYYKGHYYLFSWSPGNRFSPEIWGMWNGCSRMIRPTNLAMWQALKTAIEQGLLPIDEFQQNKFTHVEVDLELRSPAEWRGGERETR